MFDLKKPLTLAALFFCALLATTPRLVQAAPPSDRVLGKADAPITVIEYASFTCSHCAEFYTHVMPDLEKKFVETGKVKFIFRDYPMDGFSLKASSIARCMPEAQFYPFIKILFNNQAAWFRSPKPEDTLLQYAQMSGLPADKAKACLNDTKMMDSLVESRTEALEKYDIKATPTFIINNGEDTIVGAAPVEQFERAFNKILVAHQKK